MQSLASRLELELPAVPDSVPTARHAAARLATDVGAPHPNSPGLGFGLPLIGRVVDDLHVEAGPDGTYISMMFALSELDS